MFPRRSPRLLAQSGAGAVISIPVRQMKKLTSSSGKKVKASSPQEEEELPLKKFKGGTLSRDYEKTLAEKGHQIIVGIDEAGRGPLAGPVVAAACYVPLHVNIEGVQDSKQLDEPQREFLFHQLTTHPDIHYSVHITDHQRIDEINILQATLESMAATAASFPLTPDYLLIDGNRCPANLAIPNEFVIKGDSKVYAIAAASIIAKVTRDRLMRQYDAQWPEYNFKTHKGYGTAGHREAIRQFGPCPIHRMTFAPLKYL